MEKKNLEFTVFLVLLVGVFLLTFFIFRPFISILVLSAVLAVLFHPLNLKLVKLFHGKKSLVACLLVLVTLVFIIIPILFFGLQIFGQAKDFFTLARSGQFEYIQNIQQNINTLIQHFIPSYSLNIQDVVSNALSFVSDNLGALLSQTVNIFLQIFFLLFTLFFFVRDGEKMLDSFLSLSPFQKEQNNEIIVSVNQTITSVIRGTLFAGFIRFVLFAIAFYIFGIPNAILWAGIGGIIGLIPGFGTQFVIVPAFLYLLFFNNVVSAAGMGLFGILLVFFVDNLLSSYFFGKGLFVPSIFILLSILGGIIFFGPLGFIFGPIVLSLFIWILDTYKILVLNKV